MIEGVEEKEKPGECVACGNSPANHFVSYYMNTWSVGMAPAMYPFLNTRFAQTLQRLSSYTQYYFAFLYYGYSRFLQIIKYNSADKSKCITYRSQVIWEEAERRGIRMEQVKIYGRHVDTYRAFLPHKTIYFDSLPIPPWMTTSSQHWIDDKFYLKQLFARERIPVPQCVSVTNADAAEAAFVKISKPVIVKPQLGTRGRHTQTYLTNARAVREAFAVAQVLGKYVCVEEHIEGSVCRGTLVDRKLVGFFEAKPITVVGDGIHTVEELVEAKNAARHERVKVIELNTEHDIYIGKRGFTRTSVVPAGYVLPLTHRTGRLFGGETRELLDTVHPKLREYLERAARSIDVPIVGFDLIIPNPEVDPDTQTWGIIEANAVPFIDLHYLPLYGTPSRVAEKVWDLWVMR